jgi:hypothetical protein
MNNLDMQIEEASRTVEALDEALLSGKNVDEARMLAREAGGALLRSRELADDQLRRKAQIVCDTLNASDAPCSTWKLWPSSRPDAEMWQDVLGGGYYWRIADTPSQYVRREVSLRNGAFAGHEVVRIPAPGSARWEPVM